MPFSSADLVIAVLRKSQTSEAHSLAREDLPRTPLLVPIPADFLREKAIGPIKANLANSSPPVDHLEAIQIQGCHFLKDPNLQKKKNTCFFMMNKLTINGFIAEADSRKKHYPCLRLRSPTCNRSFQAEFPVVETRRNANQIQSLSTSHFFSFYSFQPFNSAFSEKTLNIFCVGLLATSSCIAKMSCCKTSGFQTFKKFSKFQPQYYQTQSEGPKCENITITFSLK